MAGSSPAGRAFRRRTAAVIASDCPGFRRSAARLRCTVSRARPSSSPIRASVQPAATSRRRSGDIVGGPAAAVHRGSPSSRRVMALSRAAGRPQIVAAVSGGTSRAGRASPCLGYGETVTRRINWKDRHRRERNRSVARSSLDATVNSRCDAGRFENNSLRLRARPESMLGDHHRTRAAMDVRSTTLVH